VKAHTGTRAPCIWGAHAGYENCKENCHAEVIFKFRVGSSPWPSEWGEVTLLGVEGRLDEGEMRLLALEPRLDDWGEEKVEDIGELSLLIVEAQLRDGEVKPE